MLLLRFTVPVFRDIYIHIFPENTILVSFDVVNMFPSIDSENGIKAVYNILEKREENKPSTDCIIEGLKICLKNNNSVFAGEHLLQTNGTATGAPNSCSYADIAVEPIDNAIFDEMKTTYSEILYYGRYRDDCLVLWCGIEDKLDSFLTFLNEQSPDLKFTMEIGGKSICFLDLKISIINQKLVTTVYSKPTDSHLYLHKQSCHNKSSIDGIQKGVALCLRRICSSNEEYDKKSSEYERYLVDRGHDIKKVKKTFTNIKQLSRSDARRKSVKNKHKRIVFSTKYNPRGPDINMILKKHLPIIENEESLNALYPKGSITVAFKREQNLKDLLLRGDPYNIKVDLEDNETHGYKKCGSSRCDSCNNFVDGTSVVKSHATGKIYKIRRDITCSTKFVIYVAYCTFCGKQDVGSTVCWKPRLRNYKSHIKKSKYTCRIVKHFVDVCVDHSLNNLRFILVDKLNNVENLTHEEIENLLLEKEKFWSGTLVTQHQGLNGTHDWNRKKRCERE